MKQPLRHSLLWALLVALLPASLVANTTGIDLAFKTQLTKTALVPYCYLGGFGDVLSGSCKNALENWSLLNSYTILLFELVAILILYYVFGRKHPSMHTNAKFLVVFSIGFVVLAQAFQPALWIILFVAGFGLPSALIAMGPLGIVMMGLVIRTIRKEFLAPKENSQ